MEIGKNYTKITIKFVLLEEYIKKIEKFINFLEICNVSLDVISKKI